MTILKLKRKEVEGLSPKKQARLKSLVGVYLKEHAIVLRAATELSKIRVKYYSSVPEGYKPPKKIDKMQDQLYAFYKYHFDILRGYEHAILVLVGRK